MNSIEKEKKAIEDNLPIILDRTPAAVLNLAGAAQQINASKTVIQSSLDEIRRKTADVSKVIENITESTSSTRNAINIQRQEVTELKKVITQGETLDAIRKEQAAALHAKEEGSRHSSWMGLWRPLAEESRTGLFVAAIAFACIAIVSVVYLFWGRIIQLFPAFSRGSSPTVKVAEARNAAAAYFGGFFAGRFPNGPKKIN
jgi:hypothetical protein